MKLFFDTETSAFVSEPHIVQLGALLTDDQGKELSSLNVIIKPEGWTISKEATDCHGITNEVAQRCGIPASIAMPAFHHLLTLADEMVAHGFAFDERVCKVAYSRHLTVPFPIEKIRFCTMQITTPICKLPYPSGRKGYKWPKLSEAYFHFFGQAFDGAHSTLADVQATKRIYFRVKELQNPTLAD